MKINKSSQTSSNTTSRELTSLLGLVLAALLGFIVLPITGHAATIIGTVNELSNTTIDLTAEGTLAWAKYNTSGSGLPPYFGSSNSIISDQAGAFNSNGFGTVEYSWSNNTVAPTSGSNNWYLVGSSGANALTFTVSPASTDARRLRIYTALFGPSSTLLTATLGSETYNGTFTQASGGPKAGYFDINFQADNISQIVNLKLEGSTVYLGAATLAIPEPSTYAMLLGGSVALLLIRRLRA
jgi:hypothetical protein